MSTNQISKMTVVGVGIVAVLLIALIFITPSTEWFSSITKSVVTPVTIFCAAVILILAVLVCSKYGSIRLGDKAPSYSTFSWISMLFAAGMGIGLLFYSSEPMILKNNPFNPGDESGATGLSLALFDWTIIPWSLYAIVGVIIGYHHYNKGTSLKISSMISAGPRTKSLVDLIMVLGIVAGLTTSLGLGVLQLVDGLSYVFGISINPYILIGSIAALGAMSAISGVDKGIKYLSNTTISTAFILLLLLAVFGYSVLGTTYCTHIASGTAKFFGNFHKYLFTYTPEVIDWSSKWSVFYQLWYLSWSAFVGAFLAKISEGRTIRQLVLGSVLIPSVMTAVWFGVISKVQMQYSTELMPVIDRSITESLFEFIKLVSNTPAIYQLISAVVMVLIILFFVTSADSGTYVIVSHTSTTNNTVEKITWSLVIAIVAGTLLTLGGLQLVQVVSVLLGVLVMLVIIFGCISLVKHLLSERV